MGESEGVILKRAREQNGPIPESIQNAPELHLGLDFTYSAFWRLCSERPVGMGPGPIPWHAVQNYAIRYGLDDDDSSDLEFLVGKMDEAYLKHMNKKSEARREFDRSLSERKPFKQKLADRGR